MLEWVQKDREKIYERIKNKGNRLIDRNYVYFSQAELAFTADFFKAYLDDESSGETDYTEE